MLNNRQIFGRKSESLAVKHLKRKGYKILEQNFRTKMGEIDIIAKDKGVIVFVEVKARRSNRFGDPKWAVTYKKQKKISMAALQYLKTTKQSNTSARFDVVSIDSSGDKLAIEVVKNAFELAYE
ncbi:MAG: YraN family protein [Desulfobacterales bacterium]|nr:YraN family protein [Desulfobacterales bacterium]